MDRIELELYLNNLLEIGALPGLLPEWTAGRRRPAGPENRDRRDRFAGVSRGGRRMGRRRRARASWLLLEERGAADHGTQIPAAAHADRQRPEPLRVSPAARLASRARQQRADRRAARPDRRRRVSATRISAGLRRCRCRCRSSISPRSVENALGRKPLVLGDADRELRRVAWCTGGAQGFFDDAIAAGADVYLSGEVSEQTMHIAAESGVAYLSAGHHATERFGVQAVGSHLSEQFDIEHLFIDIDNPV